MIYCKFNDWTAGAPCVVCGFRLPQAMKSRPIVPCGKIEQTPEELARIDGIAGEAAKPKKPSREPERCAHFLTWTNRTALATCGCASQRKNGTPTAVAECALHGDVTPLATKTKEGLRSCLTCADYEPEE